MGEKKVLTVAEVAKQLRTSTRFVYRQIKSGAIPSVKLGDRYFVPIKQFEDMLSGSQKEIIRDGK